MSPYEPENGQSDKAQIIIKIGNERTDSPYFADFALFEELAFTVHRPLISLTDKAHLRLKRGIYGLGH
jgi:hypothetical protein